MLPPQVFSSAKNSIASVAAAKITSDKNAKNFFFTTRRKPRRKA
ncbi:MAG: hypothetical protein SOW89_02385 [Eubacteriales bacterium]|nr:hypothetical protein [Eubacteriales bacterium]